MEHIAMPQLGETVTEGTILRWLKQPGDRVEVDDGLFEVSTEKVDTEVPSAFAGHLRQVLVAEGETVPVGTVLAVITDGPDDPVDEVPAPPPAAAVRRAPEPAPRAPAPSRPGRSAPVEHDPARFLSPAVRSLLAEHGLDPAQVTGSGRDGRITRNDVLAAAAPHQRGAGGGTVAAPRVVAGPDDDVVEHSRARRATAANMLASLATAAHALVVTEVDFHAVDAVRRSAELSYLPFVARAVVDAIGEFPHVNASMGDDELVVHRRVHLGIAVDVDFQALVVPVVHDADGLRLGPLATAIADVATRARNRRIGPDELGDGTFTITNVGAYGTLVTTPIINQPQVAILSTDAVRMRPTALRSGDGSWGLAVHPLGNLCLSFDHRAFDGAYASAFLARVRDLLETRDWSAEIPG